MGILIGYLLLVAAWCVMLFKFLRIRDAFESAKHDYNRLCDDNSALVRRINNYDRDIATGVLTRRIDKYGREQQDEMMKQLKIEHATHARLLAVVERAARWEAAHEALAAQDAAFAASLDCPDWEDCIDELVDVNSY